MRFPLATSCSGPHPALVLQSIKSLVFAGEVGGMDILPEVAEYLKVPNLDRDAARALYAIWHRPSSNDPTVVGTVPQLASAFLPQL